MYLYLSLSCTSSVIRNHNSNHQNSTSKLAWLTRGRVLANGAHVWQTSLVGGVVVLMATVGWAGIVGLSSSLASASDVKFHV